MNNMLAKNLISTVVPSIKTSDSGNQALQWMEFFKVSHLPIVNNQDFLGLISESDIYDLDCGDEPIGNHKLGLIRPYVYESQHIWELVDIVSKMKLTVIPVLKTDKTYLGVITLQDLAQNYAKITAADQPGGIIVLEVGIHDYSLSEISRIIEENNAKVLSLFVSGNEHTTLLNVTLKLNVNDLAAIIQSFVRFDYTIKESYLSDDAENRLFRERYESFLSYLNV
ncbi:MAG: CBS domain-containing protein [Bacteroidales bacterium]|jgi:acetoin utilization protein AcuB|nr:CBS domain-containing protein [Bacteroidales bacterium]